MEVDTKKCPICNRENHCQAELKNSICWCVSESFPEDIFALVPEEKLHRSCICKDCLNTFKEKKRKENSL